jgi:hypothetical protein
VESTLPSSLAPRHHHSISRLPNWEQTNRLEQANDALTAADLDATERLLGAIRARQRTLSERWRRAAEEARADLIAALEDEAETCAQQAGAALLRFDAATALRFYRDGIGVLADASPEACWRYIAAPRSRGSPHGRSGVATGFGP